MLFRCSLILSLFFSACASPPKPPPQNTPKPAPARKTAAPSAAQLLDDWGKRYTAWLFAGKLDQLYARFDANMKKGLPRAALDQLYQKIKPAGAPQLGKTMHSMMFGTGIYRRRLSFGDKTSKVELQIEWAVNRLARKEGPLINSFSIGRRKVAAATDKLDYQLKTKLRLPFTGTWAVMWGGTTIEQNYHAKSRDQRFAYDLVVAKNGKTYKPVSGRALVKEDYFCFGRPIVAAGAGKVAAVRKGIVDNPPGVFNKKRDELAGNHIIIDHGNGEFSLYAHLKQGSIKVGPGDKVEQGAALAQCGNSGHTSEPHLHFHLQTEPKLFKGQGLPIYFENFVRNGKVVKHGMPVQGDLIAPQK